MSLKVYASVLIFPVLAAIGLWMGGLVVWLLPIIAFISIPLAELAVKPVTENMSAEEEKARRENSAPFDRLIWAFVPILWSLILLFLFRFESFVLGHELIGAIFTLGIVCGTFGINVGHELGHRRTKFEQHLSKAALIGSLYVHFFIEHNRGHHAKVSTPEDPASSPKGRTVYEHWLRSVPGTWLEAWNLEKARLQKKGISPWSLQNEHIQLQLVQAAVVGTMIVAFGPAATLGFAGAATVGFLLLETINYVEHYGLERNKKDNGKYERVQPIHSWNSDHPIGRAVLFDLSRHSDHHANPGRPYHVLRSFPEAPQFPTGYPGMVLLATCPPLFFKVMDPLVDHWQSKHVDERAAA
ncbi:MAG: alkane 1-monooxygenase [Proteobacteria bacterium]|nr:alkane 1-monooxygenase [Pseudomonadota bacterium]MCP4918637.1 alkane 1-monooxygenase [Pseudomonadota bacterium]